MVILKATTKATTKTKKKKKQKLFLVCNYRGKIKIRKFKIFYNLEQKKKTKNPINCYIKLLIINYNEFLKFFFILE